MGKVGEYEAHATECRRLAAQIKNPKLKKQLDELPRYGTGSRVSADRELLKTIPSKHSPKQS